MIIKNTIITTIVMILLLSPLITTVQAFSEESIPVEINPYYDSKPDIWGAYVVWERQYDTNSDGYVSLYNEPSWIVLQNIATGETTNVTPSYPETRTVGMSDYYYYARCPKIWGNYVVFEYCMLNLVPHPQYFRTYLYYIPTGELSIIDTSLSYTNGELCDIYGDWIFVSQYHSYRDCGYLYNLDTEELRLLLPTEYYHIDNVVLIDEFLLYSEYNVASGVRTVRIHNLVTAKEVRLTALDIGVYDLVATGIYGNYISFTAIEHTPSTSYNVYVLDFSFANWSNTYHENIIWGSDECQDNLISVETNFTYDSNSGGMWGNYVVYYRYDTSILTPDNANIMVMNVATNESYFLSPHTGHQDKACIYMDTIVWMDGRNNELGYHDSRTDFDLYRTLTTSEMTSNMVWGIIPLFMIGGVVAVVAIAVKSIAGRF
jgi:hypothetical protein